MIRHYPRRVSNRFYAPKECHGCAREFTATDRRQKYCSKQCSINHSNDRRKLERQTRFESEALLRSYDRTLELAYARLQRLGLRWITKRELEVLGIERLDLHTERTQLENDQVVHWFYAYGLVLERKDRFRIVKRETQNPDQ